jgi:glycosyltransferase involved in cell wall biosynthesis
MAYSMNIILINHYAGSPTQGGSFRPFYLSREWVRMGHNVTIISASWTHFLNDPDETVSDFQEDNLEGINYIRLKTPKYNGNGLKRALNIFAFVAQLYRYTDRIIEKLSPDVIINSSIYPLDTYPARYLADKANARLIFEVRDLWPLSPIELGGMSPSHPFIKLMQRAEDSAYRHSDRVVCLLPKAEEHAIEHGMNPGKFNWIPNGVALDEWEENDDVLPDLYRVALDRADREQTFKIGYAGAHGIANSLSSLLEAAALLKDRSITIFLIGQGAEKAALEQQAAAMNLKNVIFLPPMSKVLIPKLLRELDVLYISLQNQRLFRFGISPNKLMDYMMAGKPIISAISAGNDPVSEADCGLSITPEDPQSIANAIQTLMDASESQRQAMGKRGKQYVIENHDYRVLARKFFQLMVDDDMIVNKEDLISLPN